MKFSKLALQTLAQCVKGEVIDEDEEGNVIDPPIRLVDTKHIGSRRWVQEYTQTFECGGKFYRTDYEVGSTEYQDTHPYDYCEDMIECREVVPVERTYISYETKNND